MVIGDPYTFAFLVDRVSVWENDTFKNGLFGISLNGELYPPALRTTTLNGDLFVLLETNSPLCFPHENQELYFKASETAFKELYEMTFPCDGSDNNCLYLLPAREILDSRHVIFIIKHQQNIRFLAAKADGSSGNLNVENIQEVVVSQLELNAMIESLRRFYEKLIVVNNAPLYKLPFFLS